MRKKLLIAIAVSLLSAATAFADWRVDVGADIPWGIGSVTSSFGGGSQSGINLLQNFVFLVPDGDILYQWPVGPLNLGVGARAFSLILETVAWPSAFAELNLGPVALDLSVGGGAFLFFGLYNSLTTGTVIIPDLAAYFKIGKIFRVGGGGMVFYDPNVVSSGAGLPYAIYLSGKFSFTF